MSVTINQLYVENHRAHEVMLGCQQRRERERREENRRARRKSGEGKKITAGHWPFSVHICKMDHFPKWSAAMVNHNTCTDDMPLFPCTLLLSFPFSILLFPLSLLFHLSFHLPLYPLSTLASLTTSPFPKRIPSLPQNETEWQSFLRQCLEFVGKAAELFPTDIFRMLSPLLEGYSQVYLSLEGIIYQNQNGGE